MSIDMQNKKEYSKLFVTVTRNLHDVFLLLAVFYAFSDQTCFRKHGLIATFLVNYEHCHTYDF